MDEAALQQRVSVVTPISQAWARMSRVCFMPFDIVKWFCLGFSLFLSGLWGSVWQFLQNALNFLPFDALDAVFVPPRPGQPVADYLQQVGPTFAAVVGVGFLVLYVIYGLTSYFAARGSFMFLDGLVHNRADLKQPWRRYARAGNALFVFKMIVTLAFWLINFVTVAVVLWLVWPDIVAEQPGARTQWALIVALPIVAVSALLYFKGMVITSDFIVPMMLREADAGLGPWRAWWVWLREFLKGHIWSIILFYLLRSVFVMAIGSIVLLACCFTCGLAALPYLSSVALLPAFAFDRLYSAYYVQQFGPRWLLFPREDAEALLCPGCRYDLRGNPGAPSCPECGYDLTNPPPMPAA